MRFCEKTLEVVEDPCGDCHCCEAVVAEALSASPTCSIRQPKKVTRTAFEQLIAEDVAWLEQQPRTLERDHIMMLLKDAPRNYYGE